jgi:hypothetical protein
VTAVGQVLNNESHFGHRENGGLIVDLFWKHGNLKDEDYVPDAFTGVPAEVLVAAYVDTTVVV